MTCCQVVLMAEKKVPTRGNGLLDMISVNVNGEKNTTGH